jgi:hypothetical protein
VGKTKADHADRLAGCGPAGPGYTGGGNGKLGKAGCRQHARRHFHGSLLADSAETLKGILVDRQLLDLGRIAIGDKASVKPFARTRCVGHGSRQQATGAGFRAGEHPAALDQDPPEFGRQLACIYCAHQKTPFLAPPPSLSPPDAFMPETAGGGHCNTATLHDATLISPATGI